MGFVGVRILPQASIAGSGDSGGFPNEPNGFTRIMEHDFTNDLSTSNWTDSGLGGLWRDNGGCTYVNDATAPKSPQRCLRATFNNGLGDGAAPINVTGWDIGEFGNEYEKVYFSTRIKIEGSNYQNQGVGTKMGFWGFNDSSSAANQGFFIIPGDGHQPSDGPQYDHGTIDTTFNMEFWQQGPVAEFNWGQNVTSARLITCGAWIHWEALFQVNTIGSANGVLKMWIDGTLIHDHSNVTYRDAGHPKGFFGYNYNPTWGGDSGQVKDRDDFMRQDHIRISGVAL